MCLLIRACGSAAWPNLGEDWVRVTHVLENVLMGHSGEGFDLGEVRIQNLDHIGRWISDERWVTNR